MPREIKPYRAKRLDNKELVYGWPLPIGDRIVIIPLEYIGDDRRSFWGFGEESNLIFELSTDVVEVDPATVSQQTGLKDKHKKPIYDGDKLKSGKRVLIVFWNDNQMQWYVKEEGFVECTPMCQWAISEQFEIIGTRERND